MGGFFSRFAQSGLLDLLANARHNQKYYFALGSVTTTSRRVWNLGGAHFRAEHATRLPPTMSPKRWCLWPGWPYARRSRALSLSPASPRLSPRVLVQRHRLADPRIGKILEISPVISYTRKCDRWPKRVPQDQFSTLHSGLFHLPDSNSFFPNSSFLNSDSLAGSVAKGQRRAKLRGRRAHPGPKEGTRSEGRPVPPAEGRGGRPAAVPRVTDTGERDML